MSKKLRQMVIEAGIVPAQAVKLMKMWQMLDEDEGVLDSSKQERTENELLDFVSDVGRLLEQERELPEMKESILDLTLSSFTQQGETCTVFMMKAGRLYAYQKLLTLKDSHGCLCFQSGDTNFVEPGHIVELNGEYRIVTDTMKVYAGESVRFIRCQVSGVAPDDLRVLEEDYAKMPNLRGASQEG